MKATFYTPRRTRFGRGVFSEVGPLAASLAKSFAVVAGSSSLRKAGVLDALEEHLRAANVFCVFFEGVAEEPECAIADRAEQFARENGCGGVIGIGGGSALDVAKCAAALAPNEGELMDYLDGVGKGKKLTHAPLAQIAIPTTSGTGAESTNNAVLRSAEAGWKRSLRDERLYPDVALIDPLLTLSLPPKLTAISGLDALCHLAEAMMCATANPLSDMAAKAGLEKVRSLVQAYRCGADEQAREDMALAAYLGGLAISNSGVTAAHALGSGVGGATGLSHGLVCGILLPHVMELNQCAAEPAALEKLDEIGHLLTNRHYSIPGDGAKAAVDYFFALNNLLGIPMDFKQWRFTANDLARMMAGKSDSSLAKNPVKLDETGWRDFLWNLM